jgi:hypothetical protein
MGYVTDFRLKIEGDESTIKKFLHSEVLVDSWGVPLIEDVLEYWNDEYVGSHKWYDYSNDMTKISSQWPELTFILTGYGEEPGDIWQYKYKNGYQTGGKAKITFDHEEDISNVRDIFK